MTTTITPERVWHFDTLHDFSHEYYKNVLNTSDLEEEELAIKNKTTQEYEYYHQARKDKTSYLIPSKYTDKEGTEQETIKKMPIRPELVEKIAYRGKAHQKIRTFNPIKIEPARTKTFKKLMDEFSDIPHENPTEYLLWKIIAYTFHTDRLNIRVMTMPGWAKDSIIVTQKLLFGNVTSVNKPSLAKLKYLINTGNTGIAINEVQNVKAEEKDDIAKFYEDVGDYKPYYENPKRSTQGASERSDITKLSTATFYNIPENDEQVAGLFDKIFEPKIRARIFPLLFLGGTQTRSACKPMPKPQGKITQEEITYLKDIIKNYLYYQKEYPKGTNQYKRKYHFDNARWQRNWETITSRIDMYAENQQEYDELEEKLYQAHTRYQEYITGTTFQDQRIIAEERIW